MEREDARNLSAEAQRVALGGIHTNRGYESWIQVHILPKWGQSIITDLLARPVEMWIDSLPLAPKSRAHIRGILSSLWKFAMWKQDIPMQVNPIAW
jgi:hypothetical protein